MWYNPLKQKRSYSQKIFVVLLKTIKVKPSESSTFTVQVTLEQQFLEQEAMNGDKCYYSNHFNSAVKFEIKIIAFTVTTTQKVCMDTHTHTQ